MSLNKDIWSSAKLLDVCDSIFAGGDVPKHSYSKVKTEELTIPVYSNGEKDNGLHGFTAEAKVNKPSVTISARGTIGFPVLRNEEFYPVVRLIVVTPDENKLDKYFLYYVLGKMDFASTGTAVKQLTVPMVKPISIPLPPLKEQKQIAGLFQEIDNSIEQTEEQAKYLIAVRTKLNNELVCKEAQFGNLLNSNNCQPSTLGAIANESRENTKTPIVEGLDRFVGLEHIEPGNLKIQGWGNVADGTTFTKIFKIGDVLFGRRRAYLKKAAHADFSGICSGDITVLRANSKLILPDLLPYYLSADPVFEYAVSNSAGSLSPRAKWRDLSKYDISLPDLEVQEKILETFQLLDANITGNKEQWGTLKKLKHQLLDEILG